MKLPPALLGVNAVCFAVLAWLYGADLSDYVRARSSAAAALTELPRIAFAIPVLVLTLVAGGVVALAALKRRDSAFKGYRLLPILLVVAIFVDVFVLSETRVPISSADQSAIALHLFARTLSLMSRNQTVPSDASALDQMVHEMGPPPYLEHGRRPDRFALQVRENCEGPIDSAPGARAGTLLYCVSKDRRQGWLTLVGLPAEQRFGDPAIFTRGGKIQFTTVAPAPPGGGDPATSEQRPEQIPFDPQRWGPAPEENARSADGQGR